MLNKSSAEKLRIVVDTSVYIAAILRPGLSEDVLRLLNQGYAELYRLRREYPVRLRRG